MNTLQRPLFRNQGGPAFPDLSGDGKSEFAVGAMYAANTMGQVTIHDGANGNVIHTIDGQANGSEFGHSMARIDDVTGDFGELEREPEISASPDTVTVTPGRAPPSGSVTWPRIRAVV